MAGGHWEVRTSYMYNSVGQRVPTTTRVWVADKGQDPNQKSGVERAAAAKAAKAKADAARIAAAKKSAAATRAAMWDTLRKNETTAYERLRGRPSPKVAPKLVDDPNVKTSIEKASAVNQMQFRLRQQKIAQDKITLKQIQERRKDALVPSKQRVADALALERLIKEARDWQMQNKDAPTSIDSQFLVALRETYEDYAQGVYDNFTKKKEAWTKLGKFNTKTGMYEPPNEAAYNKMLALMNDPEYKHLQKEMKRLFGSPALGVPDGGAYSTTNNVFDEIGKAQRQYLWNEGKANFAKTVGWLNKRGERDAAREATIEWNTNTRYMYDVGAEEVKDRPTGRKGFDIDPKTGKLIPVMRTHEEEVAFKRDQYRAEMKRQYMLATQRQMLNVINSVGGDRGIITQAIGGTKENETQGFLRQALATTGVVSTKSRADQQKVVAAAMELWDAQYGYLYKNGQKVPAPGSVAPNVDPGYFAKMQGGALPRDPVREKYLTARSEALRGFYAALGVDAPNVFEDIPDAIRPLQGLTNAIMAGPGIFGSLAKQVATVAVGKPAELIMSEGTVQLGSLPPAQQKEVAAITAKNLADKGWYQARYDAYMNTGRYTHEQVLAKMRQDAQNDAVQTVSKAFIKTPVGAAWADKNKQYPGGFGITTGRTPGEAQRIYEEAVAFQNKFNNSLVGKTGGPDWMLAIEGLAQYGAEPFTPDSILPNLIFGMILDPTNALPLKATTWLARIKYADRIINASEDVGKFTTLRKGWKGMLAFQKVTEPELRFEKVLGEAAGKLVEGVDPAMIREGLLGAILKIEKGKQREALVKALRDLGINPDTASGRNVLSLAEEALAEQFKRAKTEYKGFGQQQEEALKAYEKKRAAEQALSDETMRAVDAKNAAREKIARDEHMTAYEKVMAERKAMYEHEVELQTIEKRAADAGVEVPDRTAEIERLRVASEPKVEAPKVEVEAPKVEVEAPKVEVEAPKAEAPKAEAPKAEVKRSLVFDPKATIRVAADDAGGARKAMTYDATTETWTAHDVAPNVAAGADAVVHVVPDGTSRLSSHSMLGKVFTTFGRHSSNDRYIVKVPRSRGGESYMFDFPIGEAKKFFSTTRGKQLEADLKAMMPGSTQKAAEIDRLTETLENGWIATTPNHSGPTSTWYESSIHYLTPKDRSMIEAQIRQLERGSIPNTAVRESAVLEIEEYARRAFARLRAEQEGLGAKALDEEGMLVAEGYTYKSGPSSSHQYIAEASETARRSGATDPKAVETVMNARREFESLKWKIARKYNQMVEHKITREQFDAWMQDNVATIGVQRMVASINDDVKNFLGDFVTAGPMGWRGDFGEIAVGHAMIEDLMLPDGTLDMNTFHTYYETFSLLNSNAAIRAGDQVGAFDPVIRAQMTPQHFETFFKQFSGYGVSGPKEFRQNGEGLFNLFHMLMIDGDLKKLKRFHTVVERLLKDPRFEQDVYLNMWLIMEKRAGLAWMDDVPHDFRILEAKFEAACIATGTLHPNMTLAMIPYGAFARTLPSRYGYSRLLSQIPTTKSRLFAPAHYTSNDYSALSQIREIGIGLVQDPTTALREASQVLDYIANRYGEISRRMAFTLRTNDLNIYNTFLHLARHPETSEAWNYIRSDYIESEFQKAIALLKERNPERVITPKAEAATRAGIAENFDKLFTERALHRLDEGEIPDFNQVIRDSYEKFYWEGRITHNNPGLHTLSLLMRLQRSNLQSGDQWQGVALTYLKHMEGAGHGELGREVIESIFEAQRLSHVQETFVEVLKREASGQIPKGGDLRGVMVPDADDFWIKAGISPTVDQAEADLAMKNMDDVIERAEIEADRVLDEQKAHDDFLMDWTRMDAGATDKAANFTEEALVESQQFIVRQVNVLTEKHDEVLRNATASPWERSILVRYRGKARLAEPGEFPDSGLIPVVVVPRQIPSNVKKGTFVDNPIFDKFGGVGGVARDPDGGLIVHEGYDPVEFAKVADAIIAAGEDAPLSTKRGEVPKTGSALKRLNNIKGESAKQAFVASLPEPLRSVVRVRAQERLAAIRLNAALHAVVRQTRSIGGLSYDGEQAIKGIVEAVLRLPNGKALLHDIAVAQGENLIQSRLGQYLRDANVFDSIFMKSVAAETAERAARHRDARAARIKKQGGESRFAELDIHTAEENRAVREESGKLNRVIDDEGVDPVVETAIAAQSKDLLAAKKVIQKKISSLLDEMAEETTMAPVGASSDALMGLSPARERAFKLRRETILRIIRHDQTEAVNKMIRSGVPAEDAMRSVLESNLIFRHQLQDELDDIEEALAKGLATPKAAARTTPAKPSEVRPVLDGDKLVDKTYKDTTSRRLTDAQRADYEEQIRQLEEEISDLEQKYQARWDVMRAEAKAKVMPNPIQAANDLADSLPVGTPERAAAEQAMIDENLKATDAKGGTRESGGAIKEEPPVVDPPVVTSREEVRVSSDATMLEQISGLSEEQWIGRELEKAHKAHDAARPGTPERASAWQRLTLLTRAMRVVTVEKTGGTYIGQAARGAFGRVSARLNEERIVAAFAPKRVAPYVATFHGVVVEQGRRAHQMLRRSVLDPELGRVEMVGDVSAIYTRNGKRLDLLFDTPLTARQCQVLGFPPTWSGRVSPLTLLTSREDLEIAARNPAFKAALERLAERMESRLNHVGRASARKNNQVAYGLKQYLDDRLTSRGDYFDAAEYERVNEIVSEAINAERGWKADTWTTAVRRRGEQTGETTAELLDLELKVVLAKAEALKKLGIDPHRYNEAQKVLRGGFVAKKASAKLLRESQIEAMAEMARRGLSSETTDPKTWDANWREVYDEIFLAKRAEMAKQEALKQYERLASVDMYGAPHENIIAEFENRYGARNEVLGEQNKISRFQKKTLERAVEHYLGVPDHRDLNAVAAALSPEFQTPPFTNRAAMRSFLQKYGIWTPRTSAVVDAGGQSWSIDEEYAYFIASWGRAPEWANPHLFMPGGKYFDALHIESTYSALLREWGGYTENFDARIETSLLTRDEIVKAFADGDVDLGIHAMRDLPAMRKYVKERYGELVMDKDGNLIAMPWLMNKEELRRYVIARTSKSLDNVLPRDAESLDLLNRMVEKSLGRHFDEAMMGGKEISNYDYWRICTSIVSDLLEDPMWMKRGKDTVGSLLRARAHMVRLMVMSNPAFASSNVIDSVIKEGWASFTSRSFRSHALSKRAEGLTPEHFGFGHGTQLIQRGVVSGSKRIVRATGGGSLMDGPLARTLDGLVGTLELPAEIAGVAETAAKLRMARHMYDRAYAKALARVKDEGLADAIARKWIGEEVGRMWPTVGDGPLERFFNMLSPFISYQFKNRVLFLGELVSHPFLYNWFDKIGNAIEQYNREQWAIKYPKELLDPVKARMIELPWSPGTFFDFGTLSDASRGVAPLYDAMKGTKSIGEMASQWVRLVSASEQNLALAIANSLHFGGIYVYEPILDADGEPTGKYNRVLRPYEAPWGGEAKISGSFWLAELAEPLINDLQNGGVKLSLRGFGEFIGRMLFFGGTKTYDRGAGLNAMYWMLKDSDPNAAEAFLASPDGYDLKAWWHENSTETRDSLPVEKPAGPSESWFHQQDKVFQEKIKQDLSALRQMEKKWDHVIWAQPIGSEAMAEAKRQAQMERYDFFRLHPEMYVYEANASSLFEITNTFSRWVTDDLLSSYYAMEAPRAEDFKKQGDLIKAQAAFLQQQMAFLRMFPAVAERLAEARSGLEQIWSDTEEEWFHTLDEVGTRGIAIEAARQAEDYDLADQLYQINELSMENLTRDQSVTYFDPTTDFGTLPKGSNGPPTPRSNLLPRVQVLPDFNKWRWDRATLDKRAEMKRDERYGSGMSDIIKAAKESKDFGKTFVEEMKKKENAWLLSEYFRRNVGKREEWAANDAYIKEISRYGRLIEKGHFAEAWRYFQGMSESTKARYMKKHGLTKQGMLRNQEYGNYMGKWISYYKRRDYSGGAAYFDKLPTWVKNRYFAKHPNSGMRDGGSSPYSRAMGKWVGLLKANKDDEAKRYFDSLPQAFKDRYYAKHPEQKLRNDIKRVGQLADYFAADDANRAQYLKDNPSFAKWLKAQGTSAATRRMMITIAYQSIPKEDAWLRRVFREKYPEVFSVEAKGAASLRKTYASLAQHPEMIPSFEKWVAAIWASYAENAKHTAAPPKPLVSDHSRQRRPSLNRKVGPHRSYSAAWVRIHQV